MKKIYFSIFFLLFCLIPSFSQNIIKGNVKNAATREPLVGVSVMVKGKQVGTITDKAGNFQLSINQTLPLILTFSSVGFGIKEQEITQEKQDLQILLKETSILTQEVVVSSSRMEESFLKSGSTIDVLDSKTIQESPATNFYDVLRDLKGIDFTTNSIFFSAVNIRGANSTGNEKVAQLIDGMDNQAPGLNFPLGNLVGISELDLQRLEVIPGPASALYGSSAMNGSIIMNSKSPFQFQGLSVLLKTGIMNASNRTNADGTPMGATPMTDFSVRYAKSYHDKFAFKVNISYQKAQDWQANDTTDVSYRNYYNYETGNSQNNAAYNGVNVYGDDVRTNLANLRPAFTQLLGLPIQSLPASIAPLVVGMKQISQLTNVPIGTLVNEFIPSINVARTGYQERALADYNSYNIKLNAALHYRISDKAELILQGNYGTGTTVYTASDRYFIKNFSMGQYKVELKGSNFFIRAYTNQERSGDSHAVGIQSSLINEAWKPSFDNTNLQTLAASWFPQYGLSYAGGALQVFSNAYQKALSSGQSSSQAYQTAIDAKNVAAISLQNQARAFADIGRPSPGTSAFNELSAKIAALPIPQGAKFLDKTNLYHAEFMYNFTQFKWANVLVGGSYRMYQLRSDGTIFAKNTENGEEYNTHEIGAYAQAIKTLFKEKLKITAGLRYDKNFSFEGEVTPKISTVFSPTENHNFRISYQTGFRLPTSQEQYIDLSVPGQHDIGGVKAVIDKYDLNGKAFTELSYDAGTPQKYYYGNFGPEKVRTFEIGYKSFIKKLALFDVVYYYSVSPNKLSSVNVVKVNPDNSTEIFNIIESFPDNSISQGIAFSVKIGLPAKFVLGTNYSKDVSGNSLFNPDKFAVVSAKGDILAEIPPRDRWNFSLSNNNLFKTGISFNISYRHQTAATNFTSLVPSIAKATANQPFLPETNIIDAQISKKIHSLKTILKIGGTNLSGKIYRTTIGNPYIGSTFYVSLLFDELLNK